MRNIQRLLLIPLLLTATSCAIRIASLQGQVDKRIERLDRERARLKTLTDPVDRTKSDITISEILLNLASDAVRSGEPEVLHKRLGEYTDAIEDAHQSLMNAGRDARKKPKGFKELEITLRHQIRTLKDLGEGLTFDQREPVDRARQQASDIRDDLLKALFGEQNAPSHKG
ncbi:MAG TPA: hypothetical protein VGK48_26290 [Terriglobia bacterium]|jgi:uncharacterized coiled-coil protein SlyX